MRILYVISFPPFPIEVTGGAIRSRLLLDALSQCGDVRVLYLNYRGPDHYLRISSSSSREENYLSVSSISMPGTSGSKYRSYLEKASRAVGMFFGSGLATAGLRVSDEAERTIDELCGRNEVDLIVGRLCRPSAAAGLLAEWPVPLIIDADDWEPSRTAARLQSAPRYNLLLQAYLQRELRGNIYLGSKVLEKANHIWLASEKDTAALNRIDVTTLPNVPISDTGGEIQALGPSAQGSKIIFSVGDWGKHQNSDGMNWYLRQVWPLIRQRIPQAELRIAGVAPASLRRDWGAIQNVHLLGFVDDLRSEYEKAGVVAAPVTWGGGTKIKVLEALAYGRVPAGAKHAFEGLADPRRLENIAVIEQHALTLAEATVQILINAPMRHSQEIAAIQYYLDNYSVAAFNKYVEETVRSVMTGRAEFLSGDPLHEVVGVQS
ncbi:glycosyltransferase [Microvirga tunisiensis]|uniref:Glycosyltransferase n=1 Tax=Microvirga tunisiensis TaxID=2108360 RepID=A0A5N7MNW1_9HYPH|nr:glycosyltransferase family 4 protein [Microvirga tunisiensis]MPR10550.1 glycosyltransferase [Microvirga tunisiensis]MPR28707.1 glycosyltransferase [Microvirga tunisiensis]